MDMRVGTCIDMGIDMCIGICIDMWIGMCADMCMHTAVSGAGVGGRVAWDLTMHE